MITRRAAITAMAGAVYASRPIYSQMLPNVGGAPAGFPIRTRAGRAGDQAFDFVEHCRSLGLGVVETRLPPGGAGAIPAFRRRIESAGMRVILDIGYPREESGVAAFEADVKAARECGAYSLRTAMTGRRYEEMGSREAFRRDFERCRKSIALAEPVLRRHGMRMGIENHKGWRSAEQADWLRSVGSEWVGVHFDFGNNVALCEDPSDTLKNLLPYTVAAHIKDMAVAPYEDGFLLSEVPLGEGVLDLVSMVAALRGRNREMPLSLEVITRDPLKIPVFTDKYWVTFDESSPLPGRDLARTLDLVRKRASKSPLPHVSGLSPQEQLRLEDDQIARSIQWARQHS